MAKVAPSWRGELGTAHERGYTYAWRKARKVFLQQHPLCVMCKARGVLTPSGVVDHIKPHRGDMKLFWDEANWQAICAPCHNSTKQRMERGTLPPAIGADGMPEGW